MPPPPPPITLPASYAALPLHDIRLSHHPASSPTPTPIIILTLYRPKNYNAFTGTMLAEIESAMQLLSHDDRVKCVVFTGHGRMFCAGADLDVGFSRGDDEGEREHRDGGGRVALAIHHCRKPVIGALQGAAVGVGITMTLPMTIRIALASAKIGFVFSRRGLVSEGASSFFLPRLIGYARALHLVTTGATYRADDKLLDGLFSETRDTAEGVLERAIQIAEEVVQSTSQVSNFLVRELIWRGPGSAEETHLLDSKVLAALRGGKDNDEGVKSFMEKRAPKFEGSLTKDVPNVYPWHAPVDVGYPKSTKALKSRM